MFIQFGWRGVLCFVCLLICCVFLAAVSNIPSITAYEKGGLKVDFAFQRDPSSPSSFVVNLTATNSTPNAMTDFLFQSAVPKV